jgi:hypothetical protein
VRDQSKNDDLRWLPALASRSRPANTSRRVPGWDSSTSRSGAGRSAAGVARFGTGPRPPEATGSASSPATCITPRTRAWRGNGAWVPRTSTNSWAMHGCGAPTGCASPPPSPVCVGRSSTNTLEVDDRPGVRTCFSRRLCPKGLPWPHGGTSTTARR